MKVLYSFQGKEKSCFYRAMQIIPELNLKCNTDVLISNNKINLKPPFDVKYPLNGIDCSFLNKEGLKNWNKYFKSNISKFIKEVDGLPVEKYNLVINDFEPVSAWACMQKKIPCISISHKTVLISKNIPIHNKNRYVKYLINNYAPAHLNIGLHYCNYSKFIFTPIIRNEFRKVLLGQCEKYLVYLPAIKDTFLIDFFLKFDNTSWIIYSKNADKKKVEKNIEIKPFKEEDFMQEMAVCSGVISNVDFEVTSEILFLGKKLLAVPAKADFEQEYNADALKAIGIPVIKKLSEKNYSKIKDWIETDFKIQIDYPDITKKIVNLIFEEYFKEIYNTKLKKRKIKLLI